MFARGRATVSFITRMRGASSCARLEEGRAIRRARPARVAAVKPWNARGRRRPRRERRNGRARAATPAAASPFPSARPRGARAPRPGPRRPRSRPRRRRPPRARRADRRADSRSCARGWFHSSRTHSFRVAVAGGRPPPVKVGRRGRRCRRSDDRRGGRRDGRRDERRDERRDDLPNRRRRPTASKFAARAGAAAASSLADAALEGDQTRAEGGEPRARASRFTRSLASSWAISRSNCEMSGAAGGAATTDGEFIALRIDHPLSTRPVAMIMTTPNAPLCCRGCISARLAQKKPRPSHCDANARGLDLLEHRQGSRWRPRARRSWRLRARPT